MRREGCLRHTWLPRKTSKHTPLLVAPSSPRSVAVNHAQKAAQTYVPDVLPPGRQEGNGTFRTRPCLLVARDPLHRPLRWQGCSFFDWCKSPALLISDRTGTTALYLQRVSKGNKLLNKHLGAAPSHLALLVTAASPGRTPTGMHPGPRWYYCDFSSLLSG